MTAAPKDPAEAETGAGYDGGFAAQIEFLDHIAHGQPLPFGFVSARIMNFGKGRYKNENFNIPILKTG